MLPTDWIEVK